MKLEGICFKVEDFESLCAMDFLFLGRKIWAHPPIVGIDVMCHPRDPSVTLVLLCFGVGCMVLKLHSGDVLPEAIFKFLTDERIRFVAFGIPEKEDVFPFEELGMTQKRVDIGYLAAEIMNDSKYKNCELGYLAQKFLRVKTMIGLTEASSFERHEQIKCSICKLFITSTIGMVLLNAIANDKRSKRKSDNGSSKRSSFLKNLHSLPVLIEGWLKFGKGENGLIDEFRVRKSTKLDSQTWMLMNNQHQIVHEPDHIHPFVNYLSEPNENSSEDDLDSLRGTYRSSVDVFNIMTCRSIDKLGNGEGEGEEEEEVSAANNKKPLKGILKCPSSSRLEVSNTKSNSTSPRSHHTSGIQNSRNCLKLANSKGCNVSFQ